MTRPYELLGGEAGVRTLCEAFYDIMNTLPEAQPIRRMHGDDLEPIKEKLFEYLSGWLGGPMIYQKRHGSICMNEPHRPYAIGPRERDLWLLCMELALERVNASAEVKAILKQPLTRIADAVRNRDDSEATGTEAAVSAAPTNCASAI